MRIALAASTPGHVHPRCTRRGGCLFEERSVGLVGDDRYSVRVRHGSAGHQGDPCRRAIARMQGGPGRRRIAGAHE